MLRIADVFLNPKEIKEVDVGRAGGKIIVTYLDGKIARWINISEEFRKRTIQDITEYYTKNKVFDKDNRELESILK